MMYTVYLCDSMSYCDVTERNLNKRSSHMNAHKFCYNFGYNLFFTSIIFFTQIIFIFSIFSLMCFYLCQ